MHLVVSGGKGREVVGARWYGMVWYGLYIFIFYPSCTYYWHVLYYYYSPYKGMVVREFILFYADDIAVVARVCWWISVEVVVSC